MVNVKTELKTIDLDFRKGTLLLADIPEKMQVATKDLQLWLDRGNAKIREDARERGKTAA